jgi:CDP-diacylglycerol--serine O-phosphatidyltransferase
MTPAPASVRRREPGHRRGMRRAVVMLPNGFTLFNLFCGIYAIVLSIRGDVGSAPTWIVVGGIADAFDGRVARATGTGSRFGAELDSLVDAISFGLAPALIVFLGQPVTTQGSLDWLLVFIYSACAVMRLARFNVEQAGRAKTHFHGLPSPAAGLTLATYYWFSQTPLYNETVILFTDGTTLAQLPWHNLMRVLMAILGALMISDVPYPAMPSIGLNSVKKILGTLMVVGSIALLVFVRKEFIFPALVAYVLYGVIKWMIIGFVGRAATPDEIFWEREAELHQEDEVSEFDRPPLGQEVLEEIAEDDEDDVRVARDGRSTREREPREPREPRESRESRESRDREGRSEGRSARSPREERRPKRRDEPRRKTRTRDEPRKSETLREPRPENVRDEQPRAELARTEPLRSEPARVEPPARTDRRVEDRVAEQVAIENDPELALPVDAGDDEDQSDAERREPERKSDDEIQVRKRRRRRRGNRNRGDRPAAVDGIAIENSSADDAVEDHSGGDAPPGPPRPETPDPSGTTE